MKGPFMSAWGRGFQHFTPSEVLQRSSYNATFVALKPYPVWSITLQKITLINVAVQAEIENNKQVATMFMEYDRTKYLVNICKILQTE